MVAETGRDFGTTLRHDWAIFSSTPLTSEVLRSPEPSARPSSAADSEERQICTTCLFAESVGLCLCFLPSCAMYKDNAVRNVVAEMGRDLVFMITARLSDLSMPLKDSTLTCTVCTAADSEEQQTCTTCLFAESVGLWKRRRSYLYVCFLCMLSHVCFLPSWSWSTLLFERGLGEEGRFDVASRSQTPNSKDQMPKPQTATVATAQRPK